MNHSVGKHVREMAHANGVESFRRLTKRGCIGVSPAKSEEIPKPYARESSGRRIVRQAPTITRMEHLAVVTTGSRLA
ncbi:MAG: hypothetical protein F4Y60_10550 [Boseongicola sp. SB0664_bin_43]|uniref:Uncharacterized protein n=1 Tax=Boseongicola sp. SB0664_bin_43 TaxID=2604844 RepID=A0A6B0Y373_9RHOB|nr:hypothetical protein [Boseongicola sp. SB0664_bin_43]MYK32876.1 hypothetical protein [Boseongicola sp. SB0670_bin_30]